MWIIVIFFGISLRKLKQFSKNLGVAFNQRRASLVLLLISVITVSRTISTPIKIKYSESTGGNANELRGLIAAQSFMCVDLFFYLIMPVTMIATLVGEIMLA